MDEKKVVNIEKKAVNKVGLFFLFLFVVAGLGYGGYYYINNKDSFDFYLPWEDKKDNTKEDKKIDKKTGFKKAVDTKIYDRKINIESGKIVFTIGKVNVAVSSAFYDKDKGYILNLTLFNPTENGFSLHASNITVDGYLTNYSFDLSASPQANGSAVLTIDNSFLDLYRISTIENIKMSVEYNHGDSSKNTILRIETENNSSKNSIQAIEKITDAKNLEYSYYKTEVNSDAYKVYLLVSNNKNQDYIYNINKLLIDGKDIDVSLYTKTIPANSNYLEIISIPKASYKNIKKLVFSFLEVGNDNSIYQTKEVELTL